MREVLKLIATLLLAGGLLGCSQTGKKDEDFKPPTTKAREALEAALNHWKNGNPPGTVPGTKPAIEVVDSRWKAAPKQLQDYEIIGEEAPPSETSPRYFKVRLTMAKGPPQEVRYVVLGIDPLWVYSEKDFNNLEGTGK